MTCFDPPFEDPHARLDDEYDEESACVQCLTLKRENDALRALLGGNSCAHCRKLLPVRALRRVDSSGHLYCNIDCFYNESIAYALEQEMVP